MMQSTTMTAVLINPRIGEMASKNLSQSSVQKDDTFMNMLSERLQAKSSTDNLKEKPAQRANEVYAQEPTVKANDKEPVSAKTNQSSVSDASATTKTEKSQDTSETAAPSKEETEETLSTLESMVSLLEELLARLDVKIVEATPTERTSELDPASIGAQGINPAELLKALLEGNTEKLKALLGSVDEGQQTAEFKDLLENIETLVNKLTDKQGEVKNLLDAAVEVVNQETPKEELISQLKSQCSELIEKLKERISSLKETLEGTQEADPIQAVLPDADATKAGQQTMDSESFNEDEPEVDAKIEQKAEHAEEKSIHLKTLEPKNEASLDAKAPVLPDAVPEPNKFQDVLAAKIEKASPPLSEKPMPQAVTNQVMMKVKLMAGENKQEMEMHLKPESLGKLTLKIIHERGEVLAKITAENEQVKGILESNMQLLKDALEKNGLSVQSLSVSVGNGNSENRAQQDREGQTRVGLKGLSGLKSTPATSETLYTPSRLSQNDYIQDSQINLTA